jgi:hypothetical protein
MQAAIKAAYHRRNIVQPKLPSTNTNNEAVSEFTHVRKWAWWALRAGYCKTARKHAWNLLRGDPLSLENYRLIFCAIRGH